MSEKFQRLEMRAWWGVAVAVALLYLVTVPRQWQCEGVDEIEYLSLAHSMSAGLGYTIYGQPHVLYPPLYAALLSVPWRATGGAGWPLMYGCNAALGAAGLWLLGGWLRRRHGSAGRWAAWLLVTAYYPWSFSTRYLLSEPLFLLIGALLLILIDRMRAAGRSTAWSWAAAGLLAALAALTRFASVTLLAGVAGALLLEGWRRRSMRLAGLGLLIGGVGLAVLVGWEVRAQRLNPQATESYGKWVQALTGSGGADASKLAARGAEGASGRVSWPQRTALMGVKTGQYLLSAPRVSAHFAPLGLGLFALVLLGLGIHMRRDPWSPAAWYVLATLLVISLTSWVSSYHRYLYPLTPFLLLFAVEGWQAGTALARRPPARLVLGALAVAGLAWWASRGWPVARGGVAGIYAAALAWGVLVLLATALFWAVRPRRLAPPWLAALLVAGLALQNVGLGALRFRQTLRDETPVARNLVGLRESCRWLRGQAGPQDRVVANLPGVTSFLTGHVVAAPGEAGEGAGPAPDGAWVIVSGPLHDFPSYRAADEQRLARAMADLQLSERFSFGDAKVYKNSPL